MDVRKRQPIGIELVKRGIVTEEDVENALNEQRKSPNKKLGEILYQMNVCNPRELIQNIGDIIGIRGIILTQESIRIDMLDYISIEIAKRNKVIPFDVENGKIKVCFSESTKSRSYEAIRLLMLNKGLIVEPYLTFSSIIDSILNNFGAENDDVSIGKKIGSEDNTTEIVDSIIRNGMKLRASDIHIEPERNEIRVRYRIDGELFTATTIPIEKLPQIIGRLKAISNMHQEKQESQDGRILQYQDYNIRVSSQKNVYGE